MAATVERLGSAHVDALRALLAKDPAHNLYLLGLMEEFGVVPAGGRANFAFWGRFGAGELTAVVFVGGDGGLVVPSCSSAMHIADIAKHLHQVSLASTVGEKMCVDNLVTHLLPNASLRLSRAGRLFSVSANDLGPFTNPKLRLATEGDLRRLIPMAAESVRERFERDPLQEDPEGFPARVRQRVRTQRTYVYEDKGVLVFKLDLGCRSQFGLELEGLYTIPEARRRGHATLSLGQISRHLLSSLPRLTLWVDDLDPSLAGVARKVGFLGGKAMRLVVR